MVTGAVGLRMRDVPIIANLTMAVLLIFCGVNVPLDKLPGWMHAVAEALPLTHAIAASRLVADGASLGSVRTPVLVELALGTGYLLLGFALLRWFEFEGRRDRNTGDAHERAANRLEWLHDEPEDGRDVELLPAHLDGAAGHLRDVAFYMFRAAAVPERSSTPRSAPG